jgi:hypothetical protein
MNPELIMLSQSSKKTNTARSLLYEIGKDVKFIETNMKEWLLGTEGEGKLYNGYSFKFTR